MLAGECVQVCFIISFLLLLTTMFTRNFKFPNDDNDYDSAGRVSDVSGHL